MSASLPAQYASLQVCVHCFGCDREEMVGRNTNNDCAFNLSQKRCFTAFCSVSFYVYTFDFGYVELSRFSYFFF